MLLARVGARTAQAARMPAASAHLLYSTAGPAGSAPSPQQQQQQQQQAGGAAVPVPLDQVVQEVDGVAGFQQLLSTSPVPVILDCYADWCGPCKTLTPLLERLAHEQGGRVVLAKLNVDKHQELAAQLQVRSLPSVLGVFRGKMIRSFVGAVSEAEARDFVSTVVAAGMPEDARHTLDQQLSEADALVDAGDPASVPTAAQIYAEALAKEASVATPRAQIGLARCALLEGNLDSAAKLLDQLDAKYTDRPDARKARSLLTFARSAAEQQADAEGSGEDPLVRLRQAVDQEPGSIQARYDLAQALVAANQHEEAIDNALEMVKLERNWNDDAARKLLLSIFDVLGPDSPVARDGMKRFSNLWFL